LGGIRHGLLAIPGVALADERGNDCHLQRMRQDGDHSVSADEILKSKVDDAKRKTVIHLFQLGYQTDQIARVSGLSMDAVSQIIKARTPKRGDREEQAS
jgi:hypothetical protein